MVTHISCEQAKTLMQKESLLILDTRDQASFNTAHIPKAKLCNRANMQSIVQQTDKQTPVLIYCYRGNSSQVIANLFNQQGFQQVYSLDGGFTDWQKTFPNDVSS